MDRSKLVRNAVLGLVVSVGLALGKLVAGVLGRSTALVADAVESLADSVGSI
ncbi:MAG: cation transporter, partial [Phycisphaerales bacterium]